MSSFCELGLLIFFHSSSATKGSRTSRLAAVLAAQTRRTIGESSSIASCNSSRSTDASASRKRRASSGAAMPSTYAIDAPAAGRGSV